MLLVLLAVIMGLSFYQAFAPGLGLACNDAPLGRVSSECHQLPEKFTGCWQDLNNVGFREPAALPSISSGILYLLKPAGYAKFYAPLALLLLGVAAWFFFRQQGLSAAACVLGSLAAALNSSFFSTACWGVAGHVIAVAMTFLALGLLSDTATPGRWLRVVLAGLAVGMAVTEAADVGAILSLLVAAFVIHQAWMAEGARVRNLVQGSGRVALVAVCAGMLSAQAISELISTNVVDMTVARSASRVETNRWDWATQWSLPKRETLSLVVPGLFGFRMDTPDGGSYWGSIGRDPAWDTYEEGGPRSSAPVGLARQTGGGFYAGVLVLLLAAWSAFHACRRRSSVFDLPQRRWLRFWSLIGLVALLLAFGRHAPLYRLFYAIPYSSLIRNPVKFLQVLSMALVLLFAYGVDGVWRKYVQTAPASNAPGRGGRVSDQAADAKFDRNWVWGCWMVLGVSLLAWMLYAASREHLERYLYSVEFSDSKIPATAAFSIRQAGWFVLFFVLAAGAMAAILRGAFARRRTQWAVVLLGLIMVADLARADQPWIILANYGELYVSNPIVDALRDKPYEHRVTILPLKPPPQLVVLDKLYLLTWLQGLFPFYDVQSLDIVQMSRMPDELVAFNAAFKTTAISDFWLFVRKLQLTNTRYLLGPASDKTYLEEQKAPAQDQIRLVERFRIGPRSVTGPEVSLGQLTATPDPKGDYALFELTGALPRAKLYSNWQVNANDTAVLKELADLSFDPAGTVLVSGGVGAAPGASTNVEAGTVQIASYAPKDIVLKSDARSPTVLLLNDRFDPNWRVRVDGQLATLLRCNYLMQGVYLDAGAHQVEFKFEPPLKALYVSLGALIGGLVLAGVTMFSRSRVRVKAEEPVAEAHSEPPPAPPSETTQQPTTPPVPTRKQKRRSARSKR